MTGRWEFRAAMLVVLVFGGAPLWVTVLDWLTR